MPNSPAPIPASTILGSVAHHGDFKIMNERRAVHGDAGNEALLHQVNQQRPKTDLDDVAADSPENGPLLFLCAMNGREQVAQILRGQNFRQSVEELDQRGALRGWPSQIARTLTLLLRDASG